MGRIDSWGRGQFYSHRLRHPTETPTLRRGIEWGALAMLAVSLLGLVGWRLSGGAWGRGRVSPLRAVKTTLVAGVRAEREDQALAGHFAYSPAASGRSRDNLDSGTGPHPKAAAASVPRVRTERSSGPGLWGDLSSQTSGTPKLERNTQPFYSSLSLPHLSLQRVLFPPLHSPLEGHESGFRGKIWRL